MMTANGLTPCPGGDCHGIDHAWCAPGRHALPYDGLAAALDGLRARAGTTEGRHRA